LKNRSDKALDSDAVRGFFLRPAGPILAHVAGMQANRLKEGGRFLGRSNLRGRIIWGEAPCGCSIEPSSGAVPIPRGSQGEVHLHAKHG
jgi:hypothetical protein